jgi:hypothetical protein
VPDVGLNSESESNNHSVISSGGSTLAKERQIDAAAETALTTGQRSPKMFPKLSSRRLWFSATDLKGAGRVEEPPKRLHVAVVVAQPAAFVVPSFEEGCDGLYGHAALHLDEAPAELPEDHIERPKQIADPACKEGAVVRTTSMSVVGVRAGCPRERWTKTNVDAMHKTMARRSRQPADENIL